VTRADSSSKVAPWWAPSWAPESSSWLSRARQTSPDTFLDATALELRDGPEDVELEVARGVDLAGEVEAVGRNITPRAGDVTA